MQRNILSAAVSIACAGLATQAFALSPSDLNSATTSIVRISGSSATTNQLIAFAQNNCVSGSLAQLTTSDPSNFALLCTPDTSKIAGLAHSNLVIVKNGSSVADLSALASKTGYPFLDVFNSAFKGGCGSATAVPATSEYLDPTNPGGGTRIALPGYNKYTCPLTLTSAAAPDMGISDVEPTMLVSAGAVYGVTGTQLSALHNALLNVVVFGIPVTLELRDAMQAAQIASGTLPSSCAVGDETEQCMPTLNHQQINSIFTGNAVDWSEFGLTNPSGDNNIYIVRRIDASGTQTAAKIFFLNTPCATGLITFMPSSDGESSTAANACSFATPPAGTSTVHEGSTASDVQICLQNHNANHRWAVGLMSVQTPAVGDANTDMRFIKIDGVSPTNLNVALGRYGFWTEATLNYTGTPSGDVGRMITALTAGFSNPVVLRSVNTKFLLTNLLSTSAEPWAAGVMAPSLLVSPGSVPLINTGNLQTDLANVYTTPVNFYTRAITGSPNSCQPPSTYFATGTLSNNPK
ncbi:MAG: hypothetical protein ABS92_04680 [Thiobacillus sp. SCN 63-374]|nr:MAG: hypothetical protein ABS92_04680 [Thiobacillus sp. SCN 63-374]